MICNIFIELKSEGVTHGAGRCEHAGSPPVETHGRVETHSRASLHGDIFFEVTGQVIWQINKCKWCALQCF